MKPYFSLLALGLSVALLTGCPSSTNKATGGRSDKPVVLTLANPNAGDSDVGEWMQAVERLSHGTVQIELRSDWRVDEVRAERGTLGDVRAGRVDLAKIPARAWDTLGVDSFQALQAPLLVDSLELERRVVTGPVGEDMLAGTRAAGVEPLGVLPGPLRFPLGVSRDLLGARGYRGALIGSRPSAVAAATVRALGARYVDTAAGASVADLDGFDAALADIDGFGYDREARSVTADVVLWPRAATVVMNRDAWRRLAPGQREALSRAAREAVAPLMQQLRSFDRGGLQVLCERHFPLVRAGADGIGALRRAVEPVYRQLEADPDTRGALDRIRALKEDAPAEPVPACRAERARPAPGARALVGIWRAHVTRELLAAADREVGEAVEDNWGDVTLKLRADGRFEILNARFSGRPGFGAWSVRGDVLSFRPEGTVEQGAGQTWRFGWTLFHGSLVLRKLSVAPTALVVAPLRRD
jgi:TRAP-type C4-dicarboxylate transport system substrate-binding protein